MTDTLVTRRNTLLVGTAAAIAGAGMGGTASCSTNIATAVTDITGLIQKVQAGVVTALKTACNTVNAVVPTANTVLAVIESLMGTSLVLANLATGIAQIQAAINAIVAVGCPPPPAPTPTPAPTARAPMSANINGKTVPIVFF